ncbi:hypothetical protein [Nocardia fluminea]|uniref:Uncharacterized protein n=1 Tax=Nocardia fluminea TaxID=134984 RepID=A0A2N3VJN7_9NOCA|nr:hypothetical protein [Nocardia fluminea]PKV81839.1 hypothetical protein ATK86_6311 [Nocardia fluminea]
MRAMPTSENSGSRPPGSTGSYWPLALVLTVALASAAGVRAGWEAGVAVSVGLLALLIAYPRRTED